MDTTTTSTGRPRTSDSFHEPPSLPPEPPAGSRHHPWVWLIALVLILGAAYWMYHQYQAAQLAHQATARRGSGAVPVATGVVQKGDIGVYVEAPWRRDAVYTVTITSRVQGQIDRRPLPRRPNGAQRRPAPRHRSAALMRRSSPRFRGNWRTTKPLWRRRVSTSIAISAAFSKNAISQQQVYDQEQAVKQFEGTVKNDQGQVDERKSESCLYHITSPIERPRRPAARRSREHRAGQQHAPLWSSSRSCNPLP